MRSVIDPPARVAIARARTSRSLVPLLLAVRGMAEARARSLMDSRSPGAPESTPAKEES